MNPGNVLLFSENDPCVDIVQLYHDSRDSDPHTPLHDCPSSRDRTCMRGTQVCGVLGSVQPWHRQQCPSLGLCSSSLWAGASQGKAGIFSIVGKGLGFFLGKAALSPHAALEEFPQLSPWCPVLGTSVPKAPFPFFLKLNAPPFRSLAGPKLVFLLTHLGAGEDVPTDRGWLNSSFPLCCQPCSDQGDMAVYSQQQQLVPPLHTLMGLLGAVLRPSPFLQQGYSVVAVVGLSVWASPGLAAFSIELFFQE